MFYNIFSYVRVIYIRCSIIYLEMLYDVFIVIHLLFIICMIFYVFFCSRVIPECSPNFLYVHVICMQCSMLYFAMFYNFFMFTQYTCHVL